MFEATRFMVGGANPARDASLAEAAAEKERRASVQVNWFAGTKAAEAARLGIAWVVLELHWLASTLEHAASTLEHNASTAHAQQAAVTTTAANLVAQTIFDGVGEAVRFVDLKAASAIRSGVAEAVQHVASKRARQSAARSLARLARRAPPPPPGAGPGPELEPAQAQAPVPVPAAAAAPAPAPAAAAKRFAIGDRVLAFIDERNNVWRAGSVTRLDYTRGPPHDNDVSPYQIRLDPDPGCGRSNGRFVYAPGDDDSCVRALPEDYAPPPPKAKRFKVGDRVLAFIDEHVDDWRAGTISRLDHKGGSADDYEVSPYQIRLDPDPGCNKSNAASKGRYVYAPGDDDSCVRALPEDYDPPPPKAKRFKVGDRVLASFHDQWRAGTVSQLDYLEEGWGLEKLAPYQILLDSPCRFEEHYIFAPSDDDYCIRAFPESARDPRDLLATDQEHHHGMAGKRCVDAGDECPRYHECSDGLDCKMYHSCGKKGRQKTQLRRKLQERQREQPCCPDCDIDDKCEHPGDPALSLEAVLAFVEGGAASPTARKKKKRRSKNRNKSAAAAAAAAAGGTQDQHPAHPRGAPCDCDCHAIAAAGRKAVLAKLLEGVDFSPLFSTDAFETADLDVEQEQTLASFETTLRLHGSEGCPQDMRQSDNQTSRRCSVVR